MKILIVINTLFCVFFSAVVKAYMDRHGFSWMVSAPVILLANLAFCTASWAFARAVENQYRE